MPGTNDWLEPVGGIVTVLPLYIPLKTGPKILILRDTGVTTVAVPVNRIFGLVFGGDEQA